LCNYYYWSNGGGSGSITATEFVLYAKLERKDKTNNNVYFIVCSNGTSGTESFSSWTPSGSCPF
jgi:hypothetical protein